MRSILINCAGIAYTNPYVESTDEEMRETLEVNLIGVNNCCQALNVCVAMRMN